MSELKPPVKVRKDSAAEYRAQLLAITPGVRHDINGVPVKRIPCVGEWFEVGVNEDYPCITWQRLRLVDAISRVKSGYFPRLKNRPGTNKVWTKEHDDFIAKLLSGEPL